MEQALRLNQQALKRHSGKGIISGILLAVAAICLAIAEFLPDE